MYTYRPETVLLRGENGNKSCEEPSTTKRSGDLQLYKWIAPSDQPLRVRKSLSLGFWAGFGF